MKIVIPFDVAEGKSYNNSDGLVIDVPGCYERTLRTVKKPKSYRLRSFLITTKGFGLVKLAGMGAGQSEEFANVPTFEVLGVELSMPEWIVEPGQDLKLTVFNLLPHAAVFGGYFIGDTI